VVIAAKAAQNHLFRHVGWVKHSFLRRNPPEVGASRSLSDLKEIGCKSAWPIHISPLFWSIERLLTCKIGKWGKQGWAALSPNSQNLSSPSRILASIL